MASTKATTADGRYGAGEKARAGIEKPVALMLRLEGGLALVLGLWAFQALGGNWWLFAAL